MGTIIRHIEHDYNSYESNIRELCRKYGFLKSETIGKSVFGRDIKALTLGDAPTRSLYAGAFHGSERITATVLLRFVEELCEAYESGGRLAEVDVRKALRSKCAVFIPLVNPDGCEIALKGETACGGRAGWVKRLCGGDFAHWNANFRGVDINHNFDAGWDELHRLERESGYYGPGPTRYGGPKPHSEPETAALVNYCESRNVSYVIAFHSQGEVIYWDYNGIPTHRGRKMAEIFAASSGYALDVPIGLSAGGGFKDWFIERFRRPGFTVEVGLGKNPLPAEDGEQIYGTLEEMMMIGLLM